MARPYALQAGEGWTYNLGIDFVVKAGEVGTGRRVAVLEYVTRPGEEPEPHTHPTEDEIFYVLAGSIGFRCGEEQFDMGAGGLVFLPRGIEHAYQVRSDEVRLLVITSPADEGASGGWGGFVGEMEQAGS